MKLKHFLTLAILAIGGSNAWAQTDVTSTYLTNADFEEDEALTSTYLYGYGKDGSPYGFQTVTGWTSVVLKDATDGGYAGSAMAAGIFSYGSLTQLKGNAKAAPATNPAGEATGKCFGFFGVWGCGGYYYQTVNLVPGAYTITVPMYNQSGTQANTTYTGFFPTNGTSKTVAVNPTVGSWVNQTVSFTLTEATEGQIRIGYQSTGSGSGSNPHIFIDGVTIIYTDFKAELRTVIAQAQAINARISTLGDDITTAQTTLDDASASKTAIESAVSTLRSAISTKLGAYTGFDAAGDDITSFIVNNGFETSPTFDGTSLGSNSDPKSNATPTAGSTLLLNSTNVYQVNGWELMTTETSDYARTFTMPYNNTLYVQSNNAVAGQAVAAPTNGSSVTTDNSNLLFVEANWCPNAVLGVKQTIPLPAGSYRLTFDSYVTTSKDNANTLCGVSYGETTNYKWPAAINTWTANEVDFTLNAQTDVTISMGYKKINSVGGGSSAFLYVDNVKLTYFDPLKLAQIQWQAVHDALAALDATALPDAAENAITDALAETEPTTVEGYNTAKAALQALIDSYDGIKAAYNKLSALITLATNEKDNSTGTKAGIESAITIANSNIETRKTAADLTSDYNTLEGERETYVTGGAQPTAGNVFDFTFKINDAAVTGTSAWGTARTGSGEQYTGAPDNTYMDIGWAQSYNMNQTVASLPAGSYTLKAATRAKSSEVTSANIYVNQSNAALNKSTDNNRDNNTGGDLGNGWSWSIVDFVVLEAGAVTVGFYGQTTGQGWAGADDFHLYYNGTAPMYKEALLDAITSANTLYNNGANVGTGVFQIPESAGTDLDNAIHDANDVYEDDDASASEITEAISALQTAITAFNSAELIVPDEEDAFNLYLVDGINKTVTFKAGNPTSGGYAIGYTDDAGSFYNQAIHFKSTSTKNQYKLYIEDSAGNKFYLCTGSVYEGNDYQIRVTDNENNALAVEVIVTAEKDVYNLKNTAVNALIGSNGDTGVYTAQKYKNFNINPAEKVSVTVSCKAGKFGTVIFPFTPSVTANEDVKFYNIRSVTNNRIDLDEIAKTELEANLPYLMKNTGTSEYSETLSGWGTAAAKGYGDNFMSGTYTEDYIASDEDWTYYVLQTQNGKQAFYKVTDAFKTTPYKCYLTIQGSSNVKAFFLDFGGEDAINSIAADNMENATIFNLAGQRVNKAQKGIYIVNGKKVLVK